MVNELDRLLELALACGRADMPIAISIIADTGKGKTYRLTQFSEKFKDYVYYVPNNTTAFKARQAIRDMHGYLDLIIIDDFSWIPEYDKHNWASLLRELYDRKISKDSKDDNSRIAPIKIHASIIIANNEKTLRSRFIQELENQGVIDRFLPFRYTHSKETDRYLRKTLTKYKNHTPPMSPQLEFFDIPKKIKDCWELTDKELDTITDTYLRCRYADQVVAIMRVSHELGYEDMLPDIFEFIGDSMKPMDIIFKEGDNIDVKSSKMV